MKEWGAVQNKICRESGEGKKGSNTLGYGGTTPHQLPREKTQAAEGLLKKYQQQCINNKNYRPVIQGTQQNPRGREMQKAAMRHIKCKLINMTDKDEALRAAREEDVSGTEELKKRTKNATSLGAGSNTVEETVKQCPYKGQCSYKTPVSTEFNTWGRGGGQISQ